MIAIGLKDQYSKPLLNGLIPKYLLKLTGAERWVRHCGIPATGPKWVALNPHAPWNRRGFIVYLWIRNSTW
jgi:hypothetical protein